MITRFPFPAILCLILFALSLQGQLAFETTEVEIKAGLLDKQTTASYKFTNESDETVVITNLKSSCGCTVPELEKREYAPGESGEIKAVFNFGSRRGVQRKRIAVTTTGDNYSLLFTTHIPDWATVDPQILRWSMKDAPAPKEVRLRIEAPEDIELLSPNLNLEHFEIMDMKSGENEWIYSVMPKDTTERVTERVVFRLQARNSESKFIRDFAFHCLIR